MLYKILLFLEKLYRQVEIFQKIIGLLGKLKSKLFYLILLFYSFVLICIIPFSRDWLYKTEIKPLVEYTYKHANLCLSILLAILVAVMIFNMWKSAKHTINYVDSTKKMISDLHEYFIHDIRDNVRQLDEYSDDLRQSNNEGKVFIRNQMYKMLSDNMQVYVDFLEGYLSKYCQDTITVCIKMVELSDNEGKVARTIARSSNTKKKRAKQNEVIIIDQNDDFKYLYNGENTFFASDNLVQDYADGKYHVQEDISVWRDKYLSTLIVPIRYYSQHSRHNQVSLDLDILGFLCIDSKNTRPEWLRDDSYELNLLAVFADEMYIYIRKFKEIYSMKD